MAVALAPGLSRKLKKVLETRTDSPEVVASLAALSDIYPDNNPHARRSLRSTIERRALDINHEFLLASQPALQALDRVEEEVNALTECCDNIDKALSSCSDTTGDIISTTERLKQELEIITQRQEIVSCFLRDYQLSIDEINALKGDEMNENFFKALTHVQQIHANCKLLLRTHHQRAGLELMDMMAIYQEGAYEGLYRWVQAECRRLGDGDNPDINDLLKTAIRCLKERPVLFKYYAEEVSIMRRQALFRRFLTALTRGGPGGLPRPIEVHAHDPLRFVGDMLGWLHQALASEKELVSVLLDPDAPTDTGLAVSRNDSLKAEPVMTFVLDKISEGVCRPFKVRVEQVLQSLANLTVSYKFSNTLDFYSYTLSDMLGAEISLCKTLCELKEAAQQTFFNNLKSRGDKLLRYPPLVSVDLSPPPAVFEGVSLLLEIIDTYNSMMVPASGKKPEFGPVITSFIDPIVQMCEQAAEAHKSKGAVQSLRRRMSSDSAVLTREPSSVDALLLGNSPISSHSNNAETASIIFLVNCMSAIQQPLLNHGIAAEYAKNLGAIIKKKAGILVEKEVESILRRCGLLNKIPYVQKDAVWERPLVEVEEMSPQLLSESLRFFSDIVSGTEFGSLPEFEQMQVPHLRTETSVEVAKSLADAYELVYNAVTDPKNKYPDPKSLIRHPPRQMRTILGI